MTTVQDDPPVLPPDPRVAARFARVVLGAGVLAWIIALVAVIVAVTIEGDDPTAVATTPIAVLLAHGEVTVTSAATATVTPTVTLPSPSHTPPPTATPELPPPPSSTPEPPTRVPPSVEPEGDALTVATGGSPPVAGTVAGDAAPPCTPPEGWERYVVQPDDTLFAFVLGAGGGISVDELMAFNCLESRYLRVDQVIYLPSGAAENAPPSVPYVSGEALGVRGPRTPNCPCTIRVGVGWRREQIAAAINAAETQFTGGDFLAVTGAGTSAPFDFVMERPAGTSMEGFLFPGTYTAENDTTAEQFRDMLLSAFAANVTPSLRADAAAQGVTFYQALIIASIVQREVRGPETQKLVASVYYNRYRDGNRLGTTVAVQYALGGPDNWWPRVTGSGLKVDSPYNTYTRPGLPPTPIDSPGLSAIVAAIYPAQTEYRFHTASCDGSGEAFAVTYEEHLRNVNCE